MRGGDGRTYPVDLIARIQRHAGEAPQRTALEGPDGHIGYAELARRIELLAGELRRRRVSTIALTLDNGPAWVLLDLAALLAGICLVPLPPFFSTGQMRHALTLSGAQALVTDRPELLCGRLGLPPAGDLLDMAGSALAWINLPGDGDRVPAGICKITFTSGTTGEPKGVMLGWPHIQQVVHSLAGAVEVSAEDRHLALTPLAVLLENIAGVYVPLWRGATVSLPGCAEVGLTGSSKLDAATMTRALQQHRASTAIFSPQTLQGMVEAIESGLPAPDRLRFGAVGGAPVSPRLLRRAARLGLPIYEGYGLSECASVVCLNTPRHNRSGTVGRALPHARIGITREGEVQIARAGFAGYLGDTTAAPAVWASGDIGSLDDDGFLQLQGRRRDVFITAFGRNVSPEWVERELTLERPIQQAVLFGEARPRNLVVIHPAPGATPDALADAIGKVNADLPDYARIAGWITASEPFTPANGLLTGTGRVRRQAIYDQYRPQIENLYREEHAS
jgi:long-subunit acyl-CoA synthetase (AMP-forming)